MKEIELAVDEKELQKEAALKEKEKELQALREQMESLSQNLQSRTSEASRTGQEQANKMSNLLAELQKTSVEKKGKTDLKNDILHLTVSIQDKDVHMLLGHVPVPIWLKLSFAVYMYLVL